MYSPRSRPIVGLPENSSEHVSFLVAFAFKLIWVRCQKLRSRRRRKVEGTEVRSSLEELCSSMVRRTPELVVAQSGCSPAASNHVLRSPTLRSDTSSPQRGPPPNAALACNYVLGNNSLGVSAASMHARTQGSRIERPSASPLVPSSTGSLSHSTCRRNLQQDFGCSGTSLARWDARFTLELLVSPIALRPMRPTLVSQASEKSTAATEHT